VSDLAHQFGGRKAVNAFINAYEAAWARLQSEPTGSPQTTQDQQFEAALRDWLRYHSAMLIGELVPLTLEYARANPTLEVFPTIRHVLADEYQDLNKADQELVKTLASAGSLFVSGDDNQSIYRFRHANPAGIREFVAEHPGATGFVIDECRRCPSNIVQMSNSLIANDPARSRDAPLVSTVGLSDAEVYVVQHDSLDEEATSIAEYVDHYLRQHPDLPAGQVLILATRRVVGNRIRDALIARGRNAVSFFAEDQLANRMAAEAFCMLRLLVSPLDRVTVRTWLAFGAADGRSRSYSRLRAVAEAEAREPSEVLTEVASGRRALPYTAALVARWRVLEQRLLDVRSLTGLDLVRALWPTGAADCEDVLRLAENIAVDVPDPADILERMIEEITQPDLPPADGDEIRVMSLHKSKGLTAALGVVADCMSGALPTITANSATERDAQYQEQRRLFYVAITRATSALVISSASTLALRDAMASGVTIQGRSFHGGTVVARTSMSPFVRELGPTAPAAITTVEWRQRAGFETESR